MLKFHFTPCMFRASVAKSLQRITAKNRLKRCPHPTFQLRVMANVSQKLQSFRDSQKKSSEVDELERIKKLSLEDLAKEKIAFGRAKLRLSFETVFQD